MHTPKSLRRISILSCSVNIQALCSVRHPTVLLVALPSSILLPRNASSNSSRISWAARLRMHSGVLSSSSAISSSTDFTSSSLNRKHWTTRTLLFSFPAERLLVQTIPHPSRISLVKVSFSEKMYKTRQGLAVGFGFPCRTSRCHSTFDAKGLCS